MMQLSREERLLHIPHVTNVRDLGGYETQDGYYTKAHKFIRSACPSKIDEAGKKQLYDYGIRTVVDLRSPFEVEQLPHPLKEYQDIEYYHIDLLQSQNFSLIADNIKEYQDLSGFYIFMIEANKNQMKKIFEIFYEHPYDAIMFNCSAGKDRTGVVSALLLDLAGCHEYDIVKDYSESFENNKPILDQLKGMIKEEDEKFLGSDPRIMMKFLAYLRETYGSAKEYLLQCGLDEEQIQEIKENLTI
ncbi:MULTISPECIES: tyrosine-protein phosphatase [Coprobacillaceae]|uniref:tyrosine-protein phosphatase n=1 Tax=Coprobacillaceae TaxID=2810280 RepID=UPI000E544477|nr:MULTISPECIES: tyrosine-protein phosphatase [Coprobacillaceae]RHM58967.1 protein-tyrosine-phosphatase [Coprobacillus sp. AF33-1AC]RHS91374.1 protein-tyrosine-phosphatase [Erysipelatoclostridium sp. AM42-17]